MPFPVKSSAHAHLSKVVDENDADRLYAIYQYEYHLRNVNASLKEMNHHIDKCNEWMYVIEKCSKNLNV